jgi:trimeric autotransporter adhesin
MKKPLPQGRCLLFCLLSFFSYQFSFSQAANNTCATATDLGTVNGDCTGTSGDLFNANSTNPTGSSCGNRADVWYRFTLPAGSAFATIAVTLTSSPSTLTVNNTFIELFNTSNCTINGTSTGGCNNITASRRYTGLTGGATYYFRINTTANITSGGAAAYGFSVCVTSNDNCAAATTITPGFTVTSNLFGASNSGVAATCTGTPDDDVWFKFIAPYSYATITLHNTGSDINTSGARMQLFSGGACGSLASYACAGTSPAINATGLTPLSTYFVRIYTAGTGQAGFSDANSGFRISVTPSSPVVVGSGRMNEVYNQQILSAPQVLADPWEVTYGPDNALWVTESKGYRVFRVNPTTGVRDTVLDISQGSTFLPLGDQPFNAQFNISVNNPQGGLAGLALHPLFLDAVTPKNYVYISYVHSFQSETPAGSGCKFFTNRLVRFTYNTGTNRLESPVSLCDTLPGGNDHNSQRMFIAPVSGTDYMFYAQGDMGAGQLNCAARAQKAQLVNSYEGKILRFNLEPDADPGTLDQWIPNNNPFNATLGVQSAVWVTGIRNNQGFAYDTALNILYGSSHGPYSDDEINVIEPGRNYGHPVVIGFAADNNYNNCSAGTPKNTPASTCPIILNEAANATGIGASYKDPLFSAYPSGPTLTNIYTDIWNAPSLPNNGLWPSEGWSGLDLYTHTLVPGWKKSLVAASLKWGRLVRLRLGATGLSTVPANTVNDTVSYFGSQNRFRDLAFAPNGKDIYVVMDRSTTTSGPSSLFPVVPTCQGCLQKYTFLGYANASGLSSIPKSIDVTAGVANTCNTGTTVTIDATNNNLWVPITGPDGNIMAEINAMGQSLGVVTSSFYKNTGAIRIKSGVRYLDRNITITPTVTSFGIPVKVRLYISKAELDALIAEPLSGVSSISNLKVLKNNDPCGAAIVNAAALLSPTNTLLTDLQQGPNGYVLQVDVSGFSSFYFAASSGTLPLNLLTFKGKLQGNNTTLLEWETSSEVNTAFFTVERSIDGSTFNSIGDVTARGNGTTKTKYPFTDNTISSLASAVIYYRLKMVDRDGSFKYSGIVSIALADITDRISVFPNPVHSTVTVSIAAIHDEKVKWQVIDNTGRVVLQSNLNLLRGANMTTIDLAQLSTGSYYLRVSGTSIDKKIKLQKL